MTATATTTLTIIAITQHQNLAQRQYLYMSQKFTLLISTTTANVTGVKYFTPTITSSIITTVRMLANLTIIIATTITRPLQAILTMYVAPIIIIWPLTTYYIHR